MWHTVRETGSAVLLVTQDLGIVANYCDRVVVMHDGAIVEQWSSVQKRSPEDPYRQEMERLLLEVCRPPQANQAGPS